ncbi:XRE family transcriptional regulator [Paenibacillus faecis]|uniref:helix-turn-helix domain-containing protein n=1 Tax=Paenibacillus TaxID=44249 RepID=UPI001AFFC7EA|nr:MULTISPECIES: RodZ family helix-turn-helix domain-containing protein [Paenibacillus]MCA1294155.1 helix-turn-helix domain-containing protein [Paenibacillus sp. alder61]GIO83774.1 XRE family transcriptional regulator [Paenibacillus faecis]
MSDLGQQLKEARLARGLSLDDVQEMTKIRKRYLEAIESGDYKVLPGSFYVRAFIKTYAETVGVDADELLTEHKQQVPDVDPEPTMEPVLQKRRSSRVAERNSKWLSTTLMWSFAVLILVVIYMYFAVWGKNTDQAKGDQPDPTPVTDVRQEGSTNNAGKAAGQNGTDGTAAGDNPGGTATPPNAGSDGVNTDGGTNAGNEGTGTGGETGQQGVVVTPDGKEGSTTKFLVQASGSEPVKVVITASGKSWVEVRKGDRRGEKLYYENTSEGDVLTYDLGPEGLYVKSGASSNTVITVGGQVVTDGKSTTKIQLNLGTADSGSTSGDQGTAGNGEADGAGDQGGEG